MSSGARAGDNESFLLRAERIIDICRRMYPVRGLIVSPDIDRAFGILKDELPDITIHEYPTGMTCEDWTVPASWRAVSGSLRDETGRVLASTEESFLFVAAYSEPVDGWFTKAQIAPRCRTRPDQPDCYALEHRNAYDYRRVDWGITIPHRVWEQLSDHARYRVTIVTELKSASMKVAELILPGRRRETISICSQFDELCNDGQSSAVLGLELMRSLARRPDREFTYQLLLVPEMFGTIFYILNNRERVADTIGMLNLETLGSGREWLLKHSLQGDSLIDQVLVAALKDTQVRYRAGDFFDGYGNDERVYAWPTINIPGPALQRFPFDFYHTNRDTPDILEPGLLAEALRVCERFVSILEENFVPAYTRIAQPWLTRHGLYFDHYVSPEDFQKYNNIVLFNIDGAKSVLDLARLADLPFAALHDYLTRFVNAGLIEKLPQAVVRPAARLARQNH